MANNQIYPSRKGPYTIQGLHPHIAKQIAEWNFGDFYYDCTKNNRTFKYDLRLRRTIKNEDGSVDILRPDLIDHLMKSKFGPAFKIILMTEDDLEVDKM